MFKPLILLVGAMVVFLPATPAFGGSRSLSLVVSATLPEHVMDNGHLNVTPLTNNSIQLVQTQTVTRNNKSVILTSIVVP